MVTARSLDEQMMAASEVASEWLALARTTVMVLEDGTPADVRRALHDTVLTLTRSLILFVCGGEGGARDRRDVQPKDFLGRDWRPPDDQMDQLLRGRLGVISKTRSHLTWRGVTGQEAVMWPLGLVAREVSWVMYQFISELAAAGSPVLSIFEAAANDVKALLPPKQFRAATYEYGKARPGQIQHGLT